MKENRWALAVFSPTGGTKKVAQAIVEGTDWPSRIIDLSADFDPALGEDEVLLAALPVYEGRVPAPAVKALEKLSGEGRKAVAVVVYGNRAFEDALLEAKNTLEGRGFQVFAGAAFIAEHSLSHPIATERPDPEDKKLAAEFGKKVVEKLANGGELSVQVPGDFPYIERDKHPFIPLVGDNCIKCGLCARKCPAGAIPKEDPTTTDGDRCIHCMRCVAICPTKARSLPQAQQERIYGLLSKIAAGRREPELFL